MTTAQIIEIQKTIGTKPDGFWGPKSTAACQRYLRGFMPNPNPWPASTSGALLAFYGHTCDEDNIIAIDAPCPLYFEGKLMRKIRCHTYVASSLTRALTAAYSLAPLTVRIFDGIFNCRTIAGSAVPSLHARGAAIDIDAEHNGSFTHWPTRARMPLEVMVAFAREGWTAAGAFWSRDAMHFQATRP